MTSFARPTHTEAAGLFDHQSDLPFDRVVMIDWSARQSPAQGADTVWLAEGSLNPLACRNPPARRNFPTRAACREYLAGRLAAALAAGERTLVGWDFSFGYPPGFPAALGLAGWPELFAYFGEHVADDDRGRHNRDAVATAINRTLAERSRAPDPPSGPFWGAGSKTANAHLARRKGGFPFPAVSPAGEPIPLAEFRPAERFVAARPGAGRPKSVWQLLGTGAVGGQTIVGLKTLHTLASDPALADQVAIWPQQTGWRISPDHPIHFAEIYPSVLATRIASLEARPDITCRDEAQVVACVDHARSLADAGTLGQSFARPDGLSDANAAVSADECGWILWPGE